MSKSGKTKKRIQNQHIAGFCEIRAYDVVRGVLETEKENVTVSCTSKYLGISLFGKQIARIICQKNSCMLKVAKYNKKGRMIDKDKATLFASLAIKTGEENADSISQILQLTYCYIKSWALLSGKCADGLSLNDPILKEMEVEVKVSRKTKKVRK